MSTPYIPERAARRGVPAFLWFFLFVQGGFLVWLVTGLKRAANSTIAGPACPEELTTQTCQSAIHAATAVGTGIGIAIIVGLWVAADVILGITWAITRPRR